MTFLMSFSSFFLNILSVKAFFWKFCILHSWDIAFLTPGNSVVILLLKKVDRNSLKNWRSISLICADAKIFTRLLATRVNSCLLSLIDQHHNGFMHGRFIADNGLYAQLIMDMAKRFKVLGIGLLLDQEKAYDRVHLAYI